MDTASYMLASGSSNATHHVKMTSSNELKDVMVTGYQTISRERATGSYTIISKEDLEKRHSASLADALDGLVTVCRVRMMEEVAGSLPSVVSVR